jgi:hypothetical protein
MSIKKGLLLFLLLWIALSSCWNNSEQSIKNGEIQDTVSNEESFLNSYKSIKKSYRESESFHQCVESSVNYCHQKSVQESAIEKNDILVCDEINDDLIKQECIDSIKIFAARENNNIEWCEEVEWTKQVDCKYSIISLTAIDKKDVDLCNDIVGEWEVWTQMEEAYELARNTCKENIYSSIAVADLDPLFCKKISNRDSRNQCLDQVNSFLDYQKASKEQKENDFDITSKSFSEQ